MDPCGERSASSARQGTFFKEFKELKDEWEACRGDRGTVEHFYT